MPCQIQIHDLFQTYQLYLHPTKPFVKKFQNNFATIGLGPENLKLGNELEAINFKKNYIVCIKITNLCHGKK